MNFKTSHDSEQVHKEGNGQSSKQGKLPLKLEILNPLRLRSFVTRQGRMTNAQKAAIENYWQCFGLTVKELEAWSELWGRYSKRVLEIGFGNGKSLVKMAEAEPDTLFIGVEVHQPGIGSLLIEVGNSELTNVRVCCADARDVLNTCIPDQGLDRIQIFFPDPWPKNRHRKRRIIQPEFLSMAVKKIKLDGKIHCATDWQPYAKHMLACLEAENKIANAYPTSNYAPRPNYRPLTKFENRGQQLGHGVWDLIFEKQGRSS